MKKKVRERKKGNEIARKPITYTSPSQIALGEADRTEDREQFALVVYCHTDAQCDLKWVQDRSAKNIFCRFILPWSRTLSKIPSFFNDLNAVGWSLVWNQKRFIKWWSLPEILPLLVWEFELFQKSWENIFVTMSINYRNFNRCYRNLMARTREKNCSSLTSRS